MKALHTKRGAGGDTAGEEGRPAKPGGSGETDGVGGRDGRTPEGASAAVPPGGPAA